MSRELSLEVQPGGSQNAASKDFRERIGVQNGLWLIKTITKEGRQEVGRIWYFKFNSLL